MLEIDVRVTGDGQLIVLRSQLVRTTDCEGIVREMGLDEIRHGRMRVMGSACQYCAKCLT